MTNINDDINGNGVGVVFDVIIFIIVICLSLCIIKGPFNHCSCIHTRMYRNDEPEEGGDDLPIECDETIVKKGSNKNQYDRVKYL